MQKILKDSTKKTIRTNKRKVAEYKINIEKSVAFLYAIKLSEIKIQKIPFKIASKRIKHLEINLIKEVKALYTENYDFDRRN